MQKINCNLIGNILIILVAVVLILAGILKIVNLGAEDMIEGLAKANLSQHKTTISLLAIGCGLLLIIPATKVLGFLLATAYWGGAIVAHMTYNDSIAMPAAFLSILWLGGWLRFSFAENRVPSHASPNHQSSSVTR